MPDSNSNSNSKLSRRSYFHRRQEMASYHLKARGCSKEYFGGPELWLGRIAAWRSAAASI